MPHGIRSVKPPTRRQLAHKTLETVSAINALSSNGDYLKQTTDTLIQRLDTDVPLQIAASTAVLRRSFWGRLTWLVTGR